MMLLRTGSSQPGLKREAEAEPANRGDDSQDDQPEQLGRDGEADAAYQDDTDDCEQQSQMWFHNNYLLVQNRTAGSQELEQVSEARIKSQKLNGLAEA